MKAYDHKFPFMLCYMDFCKVPYLTVEYNDAGFQAFRTGVPH